MQTTIRLRALAVLLLLLTACDMPSSGQLTGLTLGAALSKLMDQVNDAITAARNSGDTLEIDAGRQAALAISNAQNAYQDSLNKTFDDHLDPTIRGTVNQLQTVVTGATSGVQATMSQAELSAQQIVNSLPFRPHEPQLTSFTPNFVVPSKSDYPVVVHLKGNFEYAAQSAFTPKLNISGKDYFPVTATTQELVFHIPVAIFKNASSTSYQSQYAEVRVPWKQTTFLGLRHTAMTDSYRLFLGILPGNVGKITITISTKRTDPGPQKTFTSRDFRQCSTSDCGNNDDQNHPYAVPAETGCQVVRNTSQFVNRGAGGVWSDSFSSDDGNQVVYKVTTIHKGACSIFSHCGDSGDVHFAIAFGEVCPTEVTDRTTQVIQLGWGDSQVVSAKAGTWTVAFDSFDGHHYEYTDNETDNRFLTVNGTTNSFSISAKDAATLVWP
jgi:hypothetical protein